MMMRNFQSANQYKNSRISKSRRTLGLVSLIIVILLLLFIFRNQLGSFLRTGSFGVLNMRAKTIEVVSNTGQLALRSKSAIIRENEDLASQLRLYQSNQIENRLLKEENIALKERLGRPTYRETNILATVLARPPLSPYDTLILDVGSSDGVIVGQLISEGSAVLGKIQSVSEVTSQAVLFSAPGQEISVLVGSSTTQTIAYGRGNGNFYMRLPAGADVSEGDIVSLSSFRTSFLGTVARVEEASADSFRIVYFRSPINIQNLKWIDIQGN